MNMKEINYEFSRQNARNNQHVNFATNALAAFPEEVATAQGFAELRTAFATAVDDEVLCFQPDKSYMDTPEVEETDLTRDSTFMFYKHIALAYADYCPDAEKRAHGKTLAFAFDNEGDVVRAEYTGETAMLADLADKLRQEPYAAALAALGIDDAPDQIEAANDAFNLVYMRRAAEMEGRATSFNMKALRPRTDDAFNELAKAVNALYAVNELVTKDEAKREALGKVIDDVNVVVYSLRRVIGGSTTKPTDPTEPIDPTDPSDPGTGDGGEDEGGSPGEI